MDKTELRAEHLIGYRVYAIDGEAGALRDLVVEPGAWMVRYLVVGADAWAPDHEVLLAPRALSGIDEARREVETDLSIDQVRESPSLPAGTPVVRDFEENWYRHYGWEQYWEAEVDEVAEPEPPVPPAPSVEEPLPDEVNADEPGLLRLENLRGWLAVTTDQQEIPILDLLLDDSDWSVDYFEVAVDGGNEHCLVDEDYVVGADPMAERLYLALDSAALHVAPLRRHPGARDGSQVRTLARTGTH